MTQQRTSAIPNVKAALVDNFAAALATANADGGQLRVEWGWPKSPPRQLVVVGNSGTEDQQWAALGARQREESFVIDVLIDIKDSRYKTQRAATLRAFEILGILETTLRADVTQGLNAGDNPLRYLELQVATPHHSEAPDPDGQGFWSRINWAVKATARI